MMETPIMLVITIFAARWVVRHFAVSSKGSTRLGVGGLALPLMLFAEFGFMLWLRGLSITDYLTTRDPVSGTVYYVMLGVFAVMPLLVRKKIRCHSAVIILFSFLAHLQQPGIARSVSISHGCRAKDASAIRQVAEQWKEGYNAGDASEVASLYDENAYYLTQHFISGIVQGRAGVKAYVQRGVDAGYHIDSIDIISSDCSGNLAYTVGHYEATNAGEKTFGVNLVVLKKIGNRWLIVAHEAAVPDPAKAIKRLDASSTHIRSPKVNRH